MVARTRVFRVSGFSLGYRSKSRGPEGHVARQRAARRFHVDLTCGRAFGQGGRDFGTRDHLKRRRDAVESDAGGPSQIISQDNDGPSYSARGRQCLHEGAKPH